MRISALQRFQAPTPRLVVAQRVLDKMAAAARLWSAEETGEALVGLVAPGDGESDIYLLDTIGPDESALRKSHTFQQGDARQDEILWWWQENWRARREHDAGLPAKWNAPLRYLGDWHKQPGGMRRPSHGDLYTARGWLRDAENGMEFLLAPIVTVEQYGGGDAGNRVRIDGEVCVDFWYLHLQDRDFRSITAAVHEDETMPGLRALPWHLQQPTQLEQEFAQLQERGFVPSSLVFLDLAEQGELSVCFMLWRVGAEQLLLVATPADYPARPAEVRLAVFRRTEAELHEHFLQLWREARPLPAPADWQHHAERSLAELIERLERDPAVRTKAPVSEEARGGRL